METIVLASLLRRHFLRLREDMLGSRHNKRGAAISNHSFPFSPATVLTGNKNKHEKNRNTPSNILSKYQRDMAERRTCGCYSTYMGGREGINGSELRQATLTSGRLGRPSTTFAQPPVNKITHGVDDETDDSSRSGGGGNSTTPYLICGIPTPPWRIL